MKRLLIIFLLLILSVADSAFASPLDNLQIGFNKVSNNLSVDNFGGVSPLSSLKVPLGYQDLAIKGVQLPLQAPPQNVMPVMTGATTNGVTVTASNIQNSSYQPWYAFDGKADSNSYGCLGTGSCWCTSSAPPAGGHWLQVDFGVSGSKKITQITLIAANYSYSTTALKDWEFYGSTDDVSYTKLTQGTQPMDYLLHSYSFSNGNSYRYYRINITTGYGPSSAVGIAEMQLLQ